MMASLVETKKTQIYRGYSNQSSKEGIRIVLELKKDADVENLTNMLYKKTTIGGYVWCQYAGSCRQKPETLSLKQIIDHHVDF